MKKWLAYWAKERFGLLMLIVLMFISISFVTRLILLVYSYDQVDLKLVSILGAFAIGLFYDLVAASYFSIPLILLLIILPNRWRESSYFRFFIQTTLFLSFIFLIGTATSEFFFWDEFNTRFNFIAVDYLVYTTEVVGNIRESYPVYWIIFGWLVLGILFIFLTQRLNVSISSTPMLLKKRVKVGGLLLTFPIVCMLLVSSGLHSFSNNTYINELAGDGLYELFAAYRNNELDYDQFYKKMDIHEAFRIVRHKLQTREATFTSPDEMNLERMIFHQEPERKMNVVLISIESFSASFMKAFGNKDNITPHLDSIANQGMLFTNLYATGTRTVRGLEALSLCVPPTPGQAIVRRPHNEHLFSLGQVFHEKGYESKFIYGGYGYFDNMGYFFENNDYEVDDRIKIPDDKIAYENIWGVADENLFELTLEEINKTYLHGKPFFAHVMTTSNHRPFTYPDGRIDIPSHTGRNGAVKYTDYSINKFLKEAATKPWYSNTLFVIVADHCASSAGKTELPVDKYHIPLIVFSPNAVTPQRVELLMSQIDVGPTLLGILNMNYKSKFMGIDIFESDPSQGRAFISTYQQLGFVKDNHLIILEPKQSIKEFELNSDFTVDKKSNVSSEAKEAIAWYQVASYSFKNNMMKSTFK